MENCKEISLKTRTKTGIPLLGIHLEKTILDKDTCAPMLTAALFIIARTWKQPRCPRTDGWTKKWWYMYTMEYYSIIKRKESESVELRWMNLELAIQNKVKSGREKHMKYTNTNIRNVEKWHWWTCLQGRSRDADIENELVGMELGEKRNSDSSTEIYPLPCVT